MSSMIMAVSKPKITSWSKVYYAETKMKEEPAVENAKLSSSMLAKRKEVDDSKAEIARLKRTAKPENENAVRATKNASSLKYREIIS